MIQSQDRSRWFGASDTAIIMGPWTSKSFARWWAVKLGIVHDSYSNLAMKAGTAFEHRILEYIGIRKMDRQIRRRILRLRVNLDGEDCWTVYEVKTYGGKSFKLARAYWMQCQVEMFATGKLCKLVAYHLEAEDYINWFRPIDPDRLTFIDVEYDAAWIKEQYLPRLRYLAQCLKGGVFPNAEHFDFRQGQMA